MCVPSEDSELSRALEGLGWLYSRKSPQLFDGVEVLVIISASARATPNVVNLNLAICCIHAKV